MIEIELTPVGSSSKELFYFSESEIAAIAPNGDHIRIFLKNHSQPFLVVETPKEIKWQFSMEAIVERAKKLYRDQLNNEKQND